MLNNPFYFRPTIFSFFYETIDNPFPYTSIALRPKHNFIQRGAEKLYEGKAITQQNPVYNYTTPGVYTVSLTVGNGISNDTETKTAYITAQGVGVEESGLAEKIVLYPVPVSDILFIESPVKISSIKITDLSGKIVLEIACSGEKVAVGLSNLTRGLYLVYIHTVSGNVIKKFTVN